MFGGSILSAAFLQANSTSWSDPNWWFDRLGVLGLLAMLAAVGLRYLLPEIREFLRMVVRLGNTLNLHFPQQTQALQRVEQRQEESNKTQIVILEKVSALHARPT